jgi:hypothetical protein
MTDLLLISILSRIIRSRYDIMLDPVLVLEGNSSDMQTLFN